MVNIKFKNEYGEVFSFDIQIIKSVFVEEKQEKAFKKILTNNKNYEIECE